MKKLLGSIESSECKLPNSKKLNRCPFNRFRVEQLSLWSSRLAGFDTNSVTEEAIDTKTPDTASILQSKCTLFNDTPIESEEFSSLTSPARVSWCVSVSGNREWCIGLIPQNKADQNNHFLFECGDIGAFEGSSLSSSGGSSGLMKLIMHERILGLTVDRVAKTFSLTIDGILQYHCEVAADVFPARLAFSGGVGAQISLLHADMEGIILHVQQNYTCPKPEKKTFMPQSSNFQTSLTSWDPTISNPSLVFADNNTSCKRPGAESTYPGGLIRIPVPVCTVRLILSETGSTVNWLTMGLCRSGFAVTSSDGFGRTTNTWFLKFFVSKYGCLKFFVCFLLLISLLVGVD